MSEKGRPRAIVIGAGAVGSCCGLQLQRDGFAVTMLDPAGFGHGCAEGTAGIFATGHISPAATAGAVRQFLEAAGRDSLDSPVIDKACLPSLLPWFSALAASAAPPRSAAAGAVLQALLPLAIPHMKPLLGEAGFATFMRRRGWLYVYETEDEFQRASGERDARRKAGIAVDELDGAALHALEPGLPKRFRHAALLPDIVQVPDLTGLLRALGEAALAEGATLRKAAADAITCLDDGRFIVEAGGDRLGADLVVVAAGPHSAPLVARLGLELPHAPERGYSVTLPNAGVTLSRPVSFPRQKMVAASMRGGLRLTSTAEFTDVQAPPDDRHVARQLAFAQEVFGFGAQGAERWHGDRSATPDGLPVIGSLPGNKRLILAYGHGHLGLTLAGVTATLVGAIASNRSAPIDLAPFRPERFPLVPAA